MYILYMRKKYNRKKYSKRSRYTKKRRYSKKKRTLKMRGGSGIPKLTYDQVSALVDPILPYKNSPKINVLDRIYGRNAVEFNHELFRIKEEYNNSLAEMTRAEPTLKQLLHEIEEDIKRINNQKSGVFLNLQVHDIDERRRNELRIDLRYLESEKMKMIDQKKIYADKLNGARQSLSEKESQWKQVQSQIPRLLIINAHGSKTEYMTLIPKGKELYLTTGGGQNSYISIHGAEQLGQIFGSSRYIRCYTGLIQDYLILFDTHFSPRKAPDGNTIVPYLKGGIYVERLGICESVAHGKGRGIFSFFSIRFGIPGGSW
jgi:hypothetical protein